MKQGAWPVNEDRKLVLRARDDASLLPLALESSPLALLLDGRLCSVGESEIEMSFNVDRRFSQAMGALQGGMLCVMLDFAMACAALAQIDEQETVSTATLNVAYLRPAMPGHYLARARVVKTGKRMIFMAGDLLCTESRLIATATAAFPRTPILQAA